MPEHLPVRHQTMIDLLREMRDLEGVSSSGAADGGRVSPDESRQLYSEGGPWETSGCDALDKLLVRLRAERPSQWWHLTERYLRCTSRPKRIKTERSKRGEPRLPKPGPHTEFLGHGVRPTESWSTSEVLVVVETWSPQVRLEKVRRAVDWLAKEFPWDTFRWSDVHREMAA